MAIECTGEKENISICDDDEKHMWHKESRCRAFRESVRMRV